MATLKQQKWFVSLSVNFHAVLVFNLYCGNGHIIKWLVELGVDIHAVNVLVFQWNCEWDILKSRNG
jgi:hypothetical protein